MDEEDRYLEPRFAALATAKLGYLIWPADKPVPWSDAECAAFVRGQMVRWRLTADKLLCEMPGKAEVDNGYALQWYAQGIPAMAVRDR